MSYLEPAYRELGVILNDQVRRRFDDVKAFHHSSYATGAGSWRRRSRNSPDAWPPGVRNVPTWARTRPASCASWRTVERWKR
ncbi:hypothetical protein ACFWP3_38120 [Streptomyces sp. NPDC058525]|uniref:hypothetical protein n=1 Tax=Streptomyces sp. NPDC058525 TaxID=3346538 RepID=UPI0036624897